MKDLELYGYREILASVLEHTGGGHMISTSQAAAFMGFVNPRAVYRRCPRFKMRNPLPVEIFVKDLCAYAGGGSSEPPAHKNKNRPKAGTFERSGPGLAAAKRNGLRQTRRKYVGPAPRNIYMMIISNSRQNASPYSGPLRGGPRGERRKEWSGRSPRQGRGRSKAEFLPTNGPIELSVELDGHAFALRAPDLEGAARIYEYAGRLLEDISQAFGKLKEEMDNA